MDKLVLLLPVARPLWVRYVGATLIVAAFSAVHAAVFSLSDFDALFLLLPAVFISGVLFDRGTGLYAAVLVTGLGAWRLLPPTVGTGAAPLILFFLTALGVAVVSEALRNVLERYRAADQAKELLLREMAHRTKNNLTTVCSLLRIQARASPDGEVRDSLMAAATRVQVMADVNDFLRESSHGRDVDMSAYLEELCQKLAGSLGGMRPVSINVRAENVQLPAEKAVPIGIIVNELVTNSFKYAFPDERPGIVTVSLREEPGETIVAVDDDGIGCGEEAREGLGTRLMQLMTQQLRGTLVRHPTTSGCRVTLRMPR